MLKRAILMLIAFVIFGMVAAQDNFSEEFIFVDGTVVNFPGDFLIYDEEYDQLFIANDLTDIYFFIVYERTIISEELDSLPEIMDWYFGDNVEYDVGDEEPFTLGEREGIQYTFEVNASPDYDRTVIALPVGDNGSVAVIRIQPNVENDVEELQEEDLAFSIIDTMRFIDFRAALSTVLGNSMTVDNFWMIEYPDDWTADVEAQTLTRDDASIHVSTYSPDEIEILNLKSDPIDLLYYDLFSPADETIGFNPENISFVNVRGREGIRYAFFDTVADENVRHVYFLAPLDGGWVLALDIISPLDTNILEDSTVQDMIQTVRPDDTLPPIAMMALDNAFIITGVGEVRYPDYWRVRETEEGYVSLSTLDLNMLIVGFDTAESAENAYADDLAQALLDLTVTADDNVVLNPDDILLGALQNGNPTAQLTYTDSTEVRSYERLVMTVLLEDNSVVYVGIIPQPGIDDISDDALAEALAIVNTIGE